MSPLSRAPRPLRFRPLAAECLERRCVLAGNVTATFIDGNLQLFGDAKNNNVEVRAVGDDLLVRGLDLTRVNGQTEVVFTAGALVLNDFRAVLGKGNDRLSIGDLLIAGNAQLGQGQVDTLFDAGNDQILLENVLVSGDLRVNAGAGADLVRLDLVAVAGRTELRGGSGNDQLQIIDSAITELLLDAGSGNDQVAIEDSLIGGGASIRLGIGDDTLCILGDSVLGSGAFINGNAGRDRLKLDDDALLIEFVSLLSLEVRQTVV
ncbi:MAG: hypothetical protein WEH44_09425 [Pirellulaceae bacterium]